MRCRGSRPSEPPSEPRVSSGSESASPNAASRTCSPGRVVVSALKAHEGGRTVKVVGRGKTAGTTLVQLAVPADEVAQQDQIDSVPIASSPRPGVRVLSRARSRDAARETPASVSTGVRT
jgi:hypothetical protein